MRDTSLLPDRIVRVLVRRSLVYTTLTGTLVLLSYAALGAGGMLFSNLVEGRPSVWAVSAATLVLGLLFSPLRRWMRRTIDRKLFPERHAMRQRLIALAGELPALGKLPRMGRHLVSRLRPIFGARTAMLLIADPDQRLLGVLAAAVDGDSTGGGSRPLLLALDDPGVEHLRRAGRPLAAAQLLPHGASLLCRLIDLDPTDLAVPLVHQGQLSGVLIVGGKKGGGPYSTEEQELLNLVAHHAAAVFENARLFESATYESLTGLLRREAILEQLEREIDRGLRYDRPLAVAMADLDHFREINERYGHLGGDTLLKRIADVLSQGLRSTDWIGRYGGEEFLLVLPETDMAGAAAVAEKVRGLVQSASVAMDDGGRARVTISIGLATLAQVAATHPSAVAPRDLIAAADRSLYRAKHSGRNQVFPKVA